MVPPVRSLGLSPGCSAATTLTTGASAIGDQKGQLPATVGEADNLDDYDTAPRQAITDPLEPWNRFWFRFNDIFYLHIAKPCYTAYTYVMPDEFQSGISNFFRNILFPMRFVNSLLQGKPQAAGAEFGRFLINTTVGFGGFINVTKDRKTVVPLDTVGEDFGQTLGVWGVGQGFYVVWPFLGPSSARDSVGMVADWTLDPTFYITPWLASAGVVGGLRFNELGHVLPLYEDVKDISVDPYIAMREAYITFRQNRIMH